MSCLSNIYLRLSWKWFVWLKPVLPFSLSDVVYVLTSLHMTAWMRKKREMSERENMLGKEDSSHIQGTHYRRLEEVRGCSSCNHHQSLSNIVYTSITTCVISKRILSLVNHFILTSFHLVYVMSYRISA